VFDEDSDDEDSVPHVPPPVGSLTSDIVAYDLDAFFGLVHKEEDETVEAEPTQVVEISDGAVEVIEISEQEDSERSNSEEEDHSVAGNAFSDDDDSVAGLDEGNAANDAEEGEEEEGVLFAYDDVDLPSGLGFSLPMKLVRCKRCSTLCLELGYAFHGLCFHAASPALSSFEREDTEESDANAMAEEEESTGNSHVKVHVADLRRSHAQHMNAELTFRGENVGDESRISKLKPLLLREI